LQIFNKYNAPKHQQPKIHPELHSINDQPSVPSKAPFIRLNAAKTKVLLNDDLKPNVNAEPVQRLISKETAFNIDPSDSENSNTDGTTIEEKSGNFLYIDIYVLNFIKFYIIYLAPELPDASFLPQINPDDWKYTLFGPSGVLTEIFHFVNEKRKQSIQKAPQSDLPPPSSKYILGWGKFDFISCDLFSFQMNSTLRNY
jgi:hypothetical protein